MGILVLCCLVLLFLGRIRLSPDLTNPGGLGETDKPRTNPGGSGGKGEKDSPSASSAAPKGNPNEGGRKNIDNPANTPKWKKFISDFLCSE